MTRQSSRLLAIIGLFVLAFPTLPSHASENDPPEDLITRTSGQQQGVEISASRSTQTLPKEPVFDLGGEFSSLPDGGSLQVQPVVAKGFCDLVHRDVATNHPCWRRFRTAPEDEDPTDDSVNPLSTLHTAMALARIDGAGLVVEPGRDWVYRDLPTLAHARHQVRHTNVTVFNLDIPVEFTAIEYVFDFHSGQQPIRSTTPGRPYPDMTIQSTYHEEHPAQFVTLTTLWDATATHPLTGDTLHIPKALRTVENSPTFRVIRSRHRLISPEEFGTTP